MKANNSISTASSSKVFLKLTFLGCFMLGCVYSLLLIFNTVFQAMH